MNSLVGHRSRGEILYRRTAVGSVIGLVAGAAVGLAPGTGVANATPYRAVLVLFAIGVVAGVLGYLAARNVRVGTQQVRQGDPSNGTDPVIRLSGGGRRIRTGFRHYVPSGSGWIFLIAVDIIVVASIAMFLISLGAFLQSRLDGTVWLGILALLLFPSSLAVRIYVYAPLVRDPYRLELMRQSVPAHELWATDSTIGLSALAATGQEVRQLSRRRMYLSFETDLVVWEAKGVDLVELLRIPFTAIDATESTDVQVGYEVYSGVQLSISRGGVVPSILELRPYNRISNFGKSNSAFVSAIEASKSVVS